MRRRWGTISVLTAVLTLVWLWIWEENLSSAKDLRSVVHFFTGQIVLLLVAVGVGCWWDEIYEILLINHGEDVDDNPAADFEHR